MGDHSVSGGSGGPAPGEAQPGVRPAGGLLAEDGPELAWQRG